MKLDSLEDVGTLVTIVGAACAALGVLATSLYNRFKNKREAEAADDAAKDRLIALIKEEAKKLLDVQRAEFDLEIANMKLNHATELTAVRADFERQITELKRDAENYACHVPDCPDRRPHPLRRRSREAKVGGTD